MIENEEETQFFDLLESSRKCTPWNFDCDVDATWVLTKSCCLFEIPVCEPYKSEAITESIRLNVDLDTLECFICGFTGSEITVRWEPVQK